MSLAPLFEANRHQLYYDLLLRSVNDEGTQNVALTGAYGTGKSSVLSKLAKTHGSRVVELSLSTIAPELHDIAEPSTGPAELGSRTNQIQKEIVKQLLYRLTPADVPRSRFRRASVTNKFRDWKLAAGMGMAAFLLLFGLGLLQPFVEGLLPVPWRQVLGYFILAGLAIGTAWVVIVIIRNRPAMSASVQTGPTTITLSKPTDSYFDEYLDEIVYFFQASKRDIVVIEDIDRFEDVQVFDTLRALNGLLNSSDQVGRRIVFIYAIRDSVFEQIGATRRTNDISAKYTVDESDRAKATLRRASRTKFFDVIIPVVPFVSADNARDVMSDAMKSEHFKINPALIRLAARHVADMRMIHNIRNEFEVYRSRLVVPENHIPGITDDLVFGIVLFKNTHLADFEKIRHQDSTLDRLYSVWRELVQRNLSERTIELAKHRQSRHLEVTSSARASRLGRRLVEFRDNLLEAAQAAAPRSTVALAGPATSENLDEPGTWLQIATEDAQRIHISNPNGYQSSTTLSFSAGQLTKVLGSSVRPEEWEPANLPEVDAKIAHEKSNIDFLRHHTWEMLCARTDFTVDTSSLGIKDASGELINKRMSFADVVEALLDSDLARALVRHGFLTSHFALYASSYYGNHLGPQAMEYIRRCIEPGIPDASFEMGEQEIIQLLREQDAEENDSAELFADASVFNTSIVDYLLANRPKAASTIARRLSLLGAQEQEFLDTYMAQGERPGALLATMAPFWSGVVQYAAVTAPVDASGRPALLDAVLNALPNDQFDVDETVAKVLESAYSEMSAISKPTSTERADIVLRVAQTSGAIFESLEPLNNAAREVAVKLRLFPITESNLRALIPTGPIALDVLRRDTDAYEYALDRLRDYLAVVEAAPKKVQTISDPEIFAKVLNDAASRSDPDALRRLVDRSSPNCRVSNLSDVAVKVWPLLTASKRTDPTFSNTFTYLDQFGMDEHLGSLLNRHKKITDAASYPEDDRLQVSITVLAARVEVPSTSTRVRIAASTQPGLIEATSLVPEGGDLVAKLLKRGLLTDDANAFSKDLMVDWATLEVTIAASKNYSKFVSADTLDVADIPSLIRSPVVPKETVKMVLANIGTYLVEASPRQTRAIAGAIIDTGWRLSYKILEALRAGGATPTQMTELIAAKGDELPTDQIKLLLVSMGGKYARVATGGMGRPTFDTDSAHEYLLKRLVGDTVKQIELGEFKGKGKQLVAPLLRPVT